MFFAASLPSQLNQFERANKFADSLPPGLVHLVLLTPMLTASTARHRVYPRGYGQAHSDPGQARCSARMMNDIKCSVIANGLDCVELTVKSKRCADWAELGLQVRHLAAGAESSRPVFSGFRA